MKAKISAMAKLGKQDQKPINLLLTPSWLSGLVAVLVGLFITVGVMTVFSLNNSSIQQQLISWQQSQPRMEKPLTTPGQVVTASDKPTLSGSWPLLVVWAAVGLAVYSVAVSIVNSLSKAEALREELGYVHARPNRLLAQNAERLALRMVAAVMLGVFIVVFIREVIPYSITAAHAATADFFNPTGPLYAFLSFAIVVITLHLITISLRLSLGKVRLTSSI